MAAPTRAARRCARARTRWWPGWRIFWAAWCEACRDEFPALRSRLLRLPLRGVAVELISIDAPADVSAAEEMLEGFGLSKLPAVLIDAPDPDPVVAAVGVKKWDGTLP